MVYGPLSGNVQLAQRADENQKSVAPRLGWRPWQPRDRERADRDHNRAASTERALNGCGPAALEYVRHDDDDEEAGAQQVIFITQQLTRLVLLTSLCCFSVPA